MKRLTFKEYTTPSVEVLSIMVEKGFEASLSGGTIEGVTIENWGDL